MNGVVPLTCVSVTLTHSKLARSARPRARTWQISVDRGLLFIHFLCFLWVGGEHCWSWLLPTCWPPRRSVDSGLVAIRCSLRSLILDSVFSLRAATSKCINNLVLSELEQTNKLLSVSYFIQFNLSRALGITWSTLHSGILCISLTFIIFIKIEYGSRTPGAEPNWIW